MHIEIQVALNFVISYLYNKLPRRRVNLFGEELEKALKDKFQGHWYPEKPFKGSAFRCLKTGDPIDAVLDRAARESGVLITDILENLPAELAVWVDPGEVSYRIGEKGAVKILFSESNEHHEDSSVDREVTKTFNPEAQCFQPIEAVSSSMNGLSLSPKGSPNGSSPTSTSPTFKGNLTTSPAPNSSTNGGGGGGGQTNGSGGSGGSGTGTNGTGAPFLPRSTAPLTFTTATFAQTKFGSTKLKTSSKRANRMSPTEFSNYIKQRAAMQQQLHHSHGNNGGGGGGGGHLGPIGGPSSPSRSLSPNPLALGGIQNDPYFFQNIGMGMYSAFNGGNNGSGGGGAGGVGTGGPPRNNMFDTTNHFHHDNTIYQNNGPNKFQSYMEPQNYYGMSANGQQAGPILNGGSGLNQNLSNTTNNNNSIAINNNNNASNINNNNNGVTTPVSSPGANSNQDNSKILDGLNSFYNANPGPYQHLLVAN